MNIRYIEKFFDGRQFFVVCIEGRPGFFMDTFKSIHPAREFGRDTLIAHFNLSYGEACRKIGEESAGMVDAPKVSA